MRGCHCCETRSFDRQEGCIILPCPFCRHPMSEHRRNYGIYW